MEQMTLEEYKKSVENYLNETIGSKRTNELMKNYDIDFPTFLEENWNIELTATAMLMGY